ncbi:MULTISPECIES: LuxR C-terminal-related transcriptional regulator [unclassified Cupriavidus]|uniref:helix-turn-helix transcriptional regulator n=1 Tax=unclassified Cupriavidus TaxID=2640874 RepID=UPI0003F52C5D|nr:MULTISPECIES: LuxR C-terminal-related transcriptional regulator [unclassified Cupriavidus]MBP0629238.1 response regulator transcription factor [Cupriavidus sp. AcVe19-1a]MBP0635701.1 response regulator transcription factor [Cupriavidus sp. AcVe19-6a]
MASILLIEQHPLLRLGLRHLLAQAHLPGDLTDIDPLAPIEPDLWLIEADLLVYGLPSDAAAGWAQLDDLCERLRPRRVLLLTEQPAAALSRPALPEPVRGCLHKAASAEALDAAVRLVLAGGECFPSLLLSEPASGRGDEAGTPPMLAPTEPTSHAAGPVVVPLHALRGEAPVAHASETPSSGAHLLNITERQYEVLALLARGYPIKTVSRMLNISVATAKTHACTLYQRLHVRNKGEAVYVALQRGATLDWAGPPAVRPLGACQAA